MPINYTPLCKFSHIVYKITCLTCGQGYIGETSDELHIRMNGHRSHVYNKKTPNISFEILHFRCHSFENISIEILAQVEDRNERLQIENDFMFKYRTIYPYGLNTDLNKLNINKIDNIYTFLNQVNNLILVKRGCRGSQKYSTAINCVIPDVLLGKLENEFVSTLNVKFVKTEIFKLKIKTIKKLKIACNSFKFSNKQFKDLLLDLVAYKLHSKELGNKSVSYFTVSFLQKSYENLKLNKCFSNASCYFPIKNSQVSVAFKYINPFSSKLFNYRQTAFSVTDDSVTCCCSNDEYIKYVDEFYGHVITGNLDILKNKNVRYLMKFGTKFRLNSKLNYKHAADIFRDNVHSFIKKMGYKYSLPFVSFDEWKFNILKYFNDFLHNNLNNDTYKYQSLNREDFKFIGNLQKIFVIVPVDKAANNYAFI